VLIPTRASNTELANNAAASAVDDRSAIAATFNAYQAALNAADTNAVLTLYASDAVFMQPYGASAVGTPAIGALYDADFATFRLNVTFHIAEIVVMSSEWAFARTNSVGTNTINATGVQSTEANQELFIMRRAADGPWKIARYSFSTTNPVKS
jgi:uncharacterized protein (TIGR02246 family)